MKILLTTPTYPPFNSGLGNAVSQQASNFSLAGHQVVVATGGDKRHTRLQSNGVRVEIFPIKGADTWLHPIRGEQSAFVELLRQPDWDVVILNAWQNWATDLAIKHLATMNGRKYVYSHCISTNVFFPHQPLRSLIRYLAWRPYWWRLPQHIRHLNGVIFLAGKGSDSRFDDLDLVQRCGIPLHVIPNSLSDVAVKILASRLVSLPERDRLIAVGSYNWQKGFDYVLKAYAASKACNRLPLHLYGQQYSSYTKKLSSMATALGVDTDFVFFHEGVSGDQLLSEYCKARLILSGSHTECQPLVLLDANAAGTPFVARSTGCISGMPGGVAVRRWQEMAEHIDRLEQGMDAWQCLSDLGRQAALDIYHPEQVSRKLLEVFVGESNMTAMNNHRSFSGGLS